MLTEEEKQLTGAEHEVIYRVSSHSDREDNDVEAITVVLLLDKEFVALSRGIAICSPLDIPTHRKGYRQIAKGRAIAAILDYKSWNGANVGLPQRDKSLIKPELRDDNHPAWIAYGISRYKLEPFPSLLDNEKYLIQELQNRIKKRIESLFVRVDKVEVICGNYIENGV